MLWRIDLRCDTCHETAIEVWQTKGDPFPPCPECGSARRRVHTTFPAVHGDEMDEVIDNLGRDPIRVRSKAERKRLMKEAGVVEKVQHKGLQGSDKSPHTQRFL